MKAKAKGKGKAKIVLIPGEDPSVASIYKHLIATDAGLSASAILWLKIGYSALTKIEEAIASKTIDKQAIQLEILRSLLGLRNQINMIVIMARAIGIEVDISCSLGANPIGLASSIDEERLDQPQG